MKAKTFDRILLVAAIVLGIVIFGAYRMAYAQDVDVRQSNDMNNQTAGDVSTGGNRSFALVNTMGDVDIGQCRFSTQWGTPLFSKQKILLDETCVGFQFLALGQYDLAAMHFCNDEDTLTEFASEIDCELAHNFTPPAQPITTEPKISDRSLEEHFELAQHQEQEIEYLQEEQASLVGRIDALTAYIERAPAPVQKQPELYTDEQFDAVWALLQGSKDDDDG